MYWWGDHMNGWGYALMAFSSVAFWALLILGIVALVRFTRNPRDTSSVSGSRLTPEQLLAERYARGEIDDDEYHRRVNTLSKRYQEISRP
jgi:putative membrane protein